MKADVDAYYPRIHDEVRGHIETVRLHLVEDPEYLDSDDCPYSEKLRNFLKGLCAPGRGGVAHAPSDQGVDRGVDQGVDFDFTPEKLEKQIVQLMNDMKTFGDDLKNDADASATDKAAYFRISVTLTEKLVSLMERTTDIKQFSQLQQFLLNFAEDHLSPDERTLLMDKLKSFGETQ